MRLPTATAGRRAFDLQPHLGRVFQLLGFGVWLGRRVPIAHGRIEDAAQLVITAAIRAYSAARPRATIATFAAGLF